MIIVSEQKCLKSEHVCSETVIMWRFWQPNPVYPGHPKIKIAPTHSAKPRPSDQPDPLPPPKPSLDQTTPKPPPANAHRGAGELRASPTPQTAAAQHALKQSSAG
jgi:hypothetical protein